MSGRIAEATAENIRRAAETVASGGLAVVPTETVYGVAADAGNSAAMERLYALKGRPAGKPVARMVYGAEALEGAGVEATEAARRLARRFWPGALTLVLPVAGGGLDPSRLGKFLVECLILNALFAGVSPAPKQGPQNAVLRIAPVSRIAAAAPFFTTSMNIGVEAGYTLSVNLSFPIKWPLRISAAAQMFSNPPPAQPAIIPCSTMNLPSLILS